MAYIDIKGLDSVKSMLAALTGELETASKYAQNSLAAQIREGEQAEMQADLDRPTPWAMGSLRYKQAGATSPSPAAPNVEGAAVFFETNFGYKAGLEAEQYLGVQIEGGVTAGPKRSERILQRAGVISSDVVWVPAREAPLDSYGNVPGSIISDMLSTLGLNPYGRTKDQRYALIGPKGAAVAVIWRPTIGGYAGNTWLPLLYFVPRAHYDARYDFYGRADKEVAIKWQGIYDKYVKIALEKAAQR